MSAVFHLFLSFLPSWPLRKAFSLPAVIPPPSKSQSSRFPTYLDFPYPFTAICCSTLLPWVCFALFHYFPLFFLWFSLQVSAVSSHEASCPTIAQSQKSGRITRTTFLSAAAGFSWAPTLSLSSRLRHLQPPPFQKYLIGYPFSVFSFSHFCITPEFGLVFGFAWSP